MSGEAKMFSKEQQLARSPKRTMRDRRRFDFDEARRRYEAGETTVAIAADAGVSATAVAGALKRMGVTLRPHWKVNLQIGNERLKESETCKKGHPYTPETTYMKRQNGYVVRECRLCRRKNVNARRAGLRAKGVKRLRGWTLAKKGELPICRNCGRTERVQLHHAIPRSKCRASRADLRNGIPLCGDCHTGWHASRVTVYRDVFRPDEWAYISSVELEGENIAAWLNKRYPRRPRKAAAA